MSRASATAPYARVPPPPATVAPVAEVTPDICTELITLTGDAHSVRARSLAHPNAKHGHAPNRGKRSSEYTTWRSMINRCHDPNNKSFERYGACGITVCERWRSSFETFLEDMGPKPTPQHTIDRIRGTEGYEPGNCRWATSAEQATNKRSVHRLELDGRVQSARAWALEAGICDVTLVKRLKSGVSLREALATIKKKVPRKRYEFQGEKLTVKGWARRLGVSRETVRRRLAKGATLAESLGVDRRFKTVALPLQRVLAEFDSRGATAFRDWLVAEMAGAPTADATGPLNGGTRPEPVAPQLPEVRS